LSLEPDKSLGDSQTPSIDVFSHGTQLWVQSMFDRKCSITTANRLEKYPFQIELSSS